MNDTPVDELKRSAANRGKDKGTRTTLWVVIALWLLTLGTLVVVGWNAYFEKKEEVQTLSTQIAIACERGTFGPPEFTRDVEKAVCESAQKDEAPPVVIEGPPGPPGEPGEDGTDGTDGQDGRNGEDGTDGVDGLDGRNGIDGEDGDPGVNGQDGAPGEPGAPGENGTAGETGQAGPAGPPGPQGEQGPPGQDGEDAFPFTFTFTVDKNPVQSTTYICTVESSTQATCTEMEQP